ncbi:MAG: type IV secretion system DNA-binding domain-containing protein [bacterium]
MSLVAARIAQAHPYILKQKAKALLQEEVCKGCSPDLFSVPVALEPNFEPLSERHGGTSNESLCRCVPETPPNADELIRFQIWLSPAETFDWDRSELFLKQLASSTHRLGLEISGNQEGIVLSCFCHIRDQFILAAAFRGQFGQYEITPLKKPKLSKLPSAAWDTALFCDYYPSPPYSHLLTQPTELHISPYESLIAAIACVPSPAVAHYQVLFQPVSPYHNWHRNVEIIQDIEYKLKLLSDPQYAHRHEQQVPSGDLRQMSWETEAKAHNDKPFFVAALRILLINAAADANQMLEALATISNLFQHGGRPLNAVNHEDYAPCLPPHDIRDMFLRGLTYRSGFLVNSRELTGLVHLPSSEMLNTRRLPIKPLETLPVQDKSLSEGTMIGICDYAGQQTRVCIPHDLRKRHTHVIGKPGMGKSTDIEHMILDDVKHDQGVAVFDPHGDLVERLLCLLPECCIDRTIYFNPGDPDWVPIWNPFAPHHGQDVSRKTDDLVSAIKNVVSGWGDRLEHLLRNTFYGLLHLPESTMLDASNLMSVHSHDRSRIREAVLNIIDNESARLFWENDFAQYRKDDLGPPKNKLSKLLLTDSVSRMLSQPENRIHFREIMDKGLIFLANLSSIGTEVRAVLGSFLLSLFHLTALGRQDTPDELRKLFNIYCDEAHIFITGAVENLIAETRKFNVSLTLAHQYMAQFGHEKVDALASVGSTIIFNVDSKDAYRLTKDLRGRVSVDDITGLGVGEAIVRIDTEIVRIKTLPCIPIPPNHHKDQIVEASRRRYYKPAHEVRETIRQRRISNRYGTNSYTPQITSPSLSQSGDEEFVYDEFDP